VESVSVARWAAEAGADAVVLAPPYYLPQGQPELREYVDHLVPELALPLFLYNMPGLTKVVFEAETLRAAMAHPRIIGLKDSSGNMTYFHRALSLRQERPDWSFLMGPEELLFDAVLAGGHGGVNGGANLFPRVYVDLFEAARAGDLPRARALHARVLTISASLYQVGRHPSAIIKGIKCALSLRGICDDMMAEPFQRFHEPERERIRAALADLGEI
jgi:4-hydroxy-tetrahydrodipicolinate synthase